MVALIEIIIIAVGSGGPDDLRHCLSQETVLIGALAQAIVGSGQFLGALQDAQFQIVVGAAEVGDGVAALLIDFGKREGVAPDHGEKQDGVAEDEEGYSGFCAKCAVPLAEQGEISQNEGN